MPQTCIAHQVTTARPLGVLVATVAPWSGRVTHRAPGEALRELWGEWATELGADPSLGVCAYVTPEVATLVVHGLWPSSRRDPLHRCTR